MKINEAKLKQIIAEETQAELNELREQQILNEGVFSMIWDALTGIPTGVVQNIKEWLAGKVMGLIGIEKETPFFKIMANMFGNLSMEDLTNMLSGPEKCVTATSELAGGATEYLAEMIPEMLGLETDSWFAGAVRESMGEAFLEGINRSIGEAICDLDFTSLFTGNKEEDVSEVKKRIHEMLSSNSELNEEEEKPLQKLAKGIEKRGTEGDFSKYCGGEVTQACIDKAAKAGGHRAKQASLAATFSKAKGGGPTLKYPKKKKD